MILAFGSTATDQYMNSFDEDYECMYSMKSLTNRSVMSGMAIRLKIENKTGLMTIFLALSYALN